MTEKRKSPALRFRGYTDDWEQRKLIDEVASIDTGKSNFTPQESGQYEILGSTSVIGYDDTYDYEGDFLLTARVGANAGELYRYSGKVKISDNTVFIKGEQLDFVYYALLHFDIKRLSFGTGQPLVKASELKVQEIMMPVEDTERTVIGEYFANLDNLITLHQRKLEKLKLVKKSMLEKMFPKNGSSVPEIRFKGFTDDWEQRKLGEILQERNTRTSDFESNPLYSLTIESGVTPKTDRYERSSLVTKTEDLFKIVKPNEFVTNPMNLRFGALGYNRNAFTVSVSGYYDVFSIDDDKCSGFWNSYFKTLTAMNIFDNAATGSLIEKRRVKYSTLQQLAFYMPNDLSEKAEIGKYMDTFDNLITLHQRKLEKLKLVKKSMLEKMFPKNGSSVPEIRFKGFTDDWEQRKFNDIATRESAVRKSSPDCPSIEYEDVVAEAGILNKDIRLKDSEKNGIIFDGSQVLYGKLRPYLHNWHNPDFEGVAVGDWWVLKPIHVDKSFLYRLIQTQKFDDIANQSSGSKMPRADWNLVSNSEFSIPPLIDEQVRIGTYFNDLDNLITLHQRKLKKLQVSENRCFRRCLFDIIILYE